MDSHSGALPPRERDMFLAMYADVMASGTINIGDRVTMPGTNH